MGEDGVLIAARSGPSDRARGGPPRGSHVTICGSYACVCVCGARLLSW